MVKSLLLIIRYKKFIFIIIFLWFFTVDRILLDLWLMRGYLLRLFFMRLLIGGRKEGWVCINEYVAK